MTLNVRRTVESGHVRQSFSHGRSKSVVVEKKKRRAIGSTPCAAAGARRHKPKPQPHVAEVAAEAQGRGDQLSTRSKGQVLRQLPRRRRMRARRALSDARQREADERARAE